MEANEPLTAQMVDAEYRALCAEIGQLFIQRTDLASSLEDLDRALESKRQALFQVVARHRAVAHNESILAPVPAAKKGVLRTVEEPHGK